MRLFLLLSLLVLGPAVRSTAVNASAVGIDFYHFWMPAQARAASDRALGSPYADGQAYAAVLNAVADRLWRDAGASAQATHGMAQARAELQRIHARAGAAKRAQIEERELFLIANARRRRVDLTATPLLYAACAGLPASYTGAAALFAALKFCCFLLGTALLWRARGGGWTQGVFLGLVLMLLFLPYRDDLNVGNLGSIHLLFAALPLFVVARPLASAADDRSRVRWAGVAFALLALFVLLKPNFALAAAGVAAHVGRGLGWRGSARAALLALPAVLLLALWPCLYFGSFGIWFDWLIYIGGDAGKLAYSIKKHNLSTPLHFAAWWGGSWPGYAWGIGAFLLLTGAAVVARAPGAGVAARFKRVLGSVLADPFVAATFGLVVMLATAPLVWNHYMVIAVVPLAWAAQRGRLGVECGLVFASLLLYSHSFLPLLSSAGLLVGTSDEVQPAVALAWLPLWLGLLLSIARRARVAGSAPGRDGCGLASADRHRYA